MKHFQERKIVVRFLICILGIITAIWGILIWNDTRIYQLDISEYTVYQTGLDGYEMGVESANCSRDEVSITKDYITVSGWVINEYESMDRVKIQVVLIDSETGVAYVVPTTVQERADITEYFGTNNFDWSGFSMNIPYGNVIDTEKNNYRIAALLKVNDYNAVVVDSMRNTEEFRKNAESE